jgi:peptidyl-prolyl cis-trans isomerase B (cyclophilin B)
MRTLTALGGVAATALLLAGCGSGTDSGSTADSGSTGASDTGGGACTYTSTGDASKKVDPPPGDPDPAKSVTITTNRGKITATLDTAKAPCTTGSFTSLARQKYFDGTKCHRLTTDGIFVLQCGDPTATGSGGPGYSFADELDGQETYPAGTLAMANAGPDTNGSQFFIVYADTSLPPSYTVFGKIDAAGLKVVTDIAKAGTSDGAPDGAPKQDVTIESVS